MGVFDKMLDAMRLGDGDYDDDYEDDEELEEEEDSKKSVLFTKKSEDAPAPKPKASISRFSSVRGGKKTSSGMEVIVVKPSGFEDARDISETLLADRTVVLNMEGLDLALAQRIIDFVSGACYAIDGNLQKVTNFIFLVTPHGVDISGDITEIMNAFDFSGIQTGF